MPTDPIRLRNPVVLVHGLGAKGAYGPFDYFHGLPKRLRAAGNEVVIADLTAWHSIEHRAQQLKAQIEAALPEGKVNLIGHSMGGLDARYLTSKLGFGERVASVTTIGTPHRGSIMGDIAMGLFPEAAAAKVEKLLNFLGSSSGGLRQVTKKHCSEVFANECPDAPGVAYFSATSAIPKNFMRTSLPIFWVPYHMIKSLDGDNDGFVSVESSTWGTHICTYVGDHYGQIGQFLGRSRGLDFLAFHDEILTRLKSEGF